MVSKLSFDFPYVVVLAFSLTVAMYRHQFLLSAVAVALAAAVVALAADEKKCQPHAPNFHWQPLKVLLPDVSQYHRKCFEAWQLDHRHYWRRRYSP